MAIRKRKAVVWRKRKWTFRWSEGRSDGSVRKKAKCVFCAVLCCAVLFWELACFVVAGLFCESLRRRRRQASLRRAGLLDFGREPHRSRVFVDQREPRSGSRGETFL